MWNVGNLFNLAAQTASNNLGSNGDTVATDRVTYVSQSEPSVANALSTNGLITKNIIYFGHGGATEVSGSFYSALFVGQDPVSDENLTSLNVGELPNSNSILGPSVTVTLNACEAAWNGPYSIAQAIANRLRRTVFAYTTGMFFSTDPNATKPKDKSFQNKPPIYMRPWGGGKPTPFYPQ